MTQLFAITIDEKIQCLKREISMRKIAYPGWVLRGKLTQVKADREIEVMEAILRDYEK